MIFNKVVVIIPDGCGIGELPDAKKFNDQGSNTLGNIAKKISLSLPNLKKLGLGKIVTLYPNKKKSKIIGSYGKLKEASPGKDTTTGHWELAGIILKNSFPTYPEGFPEEIITEFEKKIKRKTLGNYPASGTEIIKQLGEKHLKTGYPIVYTSADSVFQIAAHIDVIPLKQLYKFCEIARKILKPPHQVARVIARPFRGTPKNFYRTPDRKDFSIPPPKKTLLDYLKQSSLEVIGVGKIEDIFVNQGLTKSYHTKNNSESLKKTEEVFEKLKKGLIITNLIDFDMLYGHRNDIYGYARALKELDRWLGNFIKRIDNNSILFITSDHGNDPTTPSTDHSREYTPLLIYSQKIKSIDLGIRETFADVGKTIAEIFQVKNKLYGKSFLNELIS